VAVLDGGVVQQVDHPDVIVQRPANRRVAGLMCQRLAPMNFLDGTLVEAAANVVLRVSGEEVPVPAAVAANWWPYRGWDVTVGIRPENIVVSDNNPGTGVIPGTVILIELIGHTLMGTCAALGRDLTGLANGKRTMVSGQQVLLKVDWAQAMLFDQKSGQALSIPAG
jgi:ABC-type sugar transport system ATPase subunit